MNTESGEFGQIRRIREVLAYHDPTNRWLRLFFDEVQFPDGSRGRYNRVVEGDGEETPGVVVVPLLDAGGIVFVRQFRYPIGRFMLELPRGYGQANATPLVSAARELEEETSYTARNLVCLGSVFPNSGVLATRIEVFVATALKSHGTRPSSEREVTDVHVLKPEEVDKAILSGEISDAITLAAWLLYRLKGNPAVLEARSE